jgi:SnoaL-like domain
LTVCAVTREMTSSPESWLAELNARHEIHEVLVRYCRGADRCDAALMKSCFHDDAWDDHGFFCGPATEFVEQAARNLRERFVSTRHYMMNESVMLSGDQAKSEVYILAVCRRVIDGETFDVTFHARYLDQFECRGGAWKIVHRLLVSDGTRVDKIVQEDSRLNQARPGARGADDPSHGFFDLTSRQGGST